jgi:hypothetical protein
MPETPESDGQDPDRRLGSIEIVAPYARIRVIVAVIVFVIAIAVIAVRGLSG